MIRLLAAERLKMKGTWIPILLFLGPLGLIIAMMVDFGLRKEYLLQQNTDNWTVLMGEVSMLLPLMLLLGATLLASLLAEMEHQASAWKHTLSLPLSRLKIYGSKGIQLIGLLIIVAVLMVLTFAFLWFWIDLGKPVPWNQFLQAGFYPVLAVLPVAMLQLWLSIIIRNQALPIFIGVVCSLFGGIHTKWLPWAYPMNAIPIDSLEKNNPAFWVPVGIGLGLLFLILGALDFSQREVKGG